MMHRGDTDVRRQIRERLERGETVATIVLALGATRRAVEYQKQSLGLPLSVSLEIGDRVRCRDGRVGWIKKLLTKGAIISGAGERWFAAYNRIEYEPLKDELYRRAALIRAHSQGSCIDDESV